MDQWINENTYEVTYDVEDVELVLADVDVEISGAEDAVGNPMNVSEHADFFDIDMTPISVGEHVADEMKLFPNPTDGTATLFLGNCWPRKRARS